MKYMDKLQTVTVNFGDGRVVDLEEEDLDHLVPAFSMTIHKSQGSGATRSLLKR